MKKLIVILMTALSTATALAGTRVIKKKSAAEVKAQQPSEMQHLTLYYGDDIKALEDFRQSYPTESQALTLFPDYQYPVRKTKEGKIETYIIFYAQSKTLIEKTPDQLNLSNLASFDTVKKMLPSVSARQIGPQELIQNLIAQKTPITSFKWCNDSNARYERPERVTDLDHLRKHNFCENSICVESCAIFPDTWLKFVNGEQTFAYIASLFGSHRVPHDPGMAMQYELKYLNEKNYPYNLQELTGIKAPVIGVLEQNIFYINQLFEYGKVLMIFQQNPDDPQTTVMSSFATFPIHEHSWTGYGKLNSVLHNVVIGAAKTLNDPNSDNIQAGLPIFIQKIASRIASLLD